MGVGVLVLFDDQVDGRLHEGWMIVYSRYNALFYLKVTYSTADTVLYPYGKHTQVR